MFSVALNLFSKYHLVSFPGDLLQISLQRNELTNFYSPWNHQKNIDFSDNLQEDS